LLEEVFTGEVLLTKGRGEQGGEGGNKGKGIYRKGGEKGLLSPHPAVRNEGKIF